MKAISKDETNSKAGGVSTDLVMVPGASVYHNGLFYRIAQIY